MFSVTDASLLISQMLPEPHAGLLSGILFGSKSTMNQELYNGLVATGTLHIAALSGMNITILVGICAQILLPWFSRRIASLLTVLIIIGFVWFVGPSASVIRAAIMGCLTLIAIVMGKQVWAIWSLIITICIMIAVYPLYLTEISFLLSAGASMGLILFGSEVKVYQRVKKESRIKKAFGKLAEFVRFVKFGRNRNEKWVPEMGTVVKPIENNEVGKRVNYILFNLENIIISDLRVTLAAQVFTIPIILLYFRRISLISPIANLLIGWSIPFVTVFGMVSVWLGLIYFPLGQIAAWAAWGLLEYIIRIVDMTARIPFGSLGY